MFSQVQTAILLNSPKVGNKWIDMLLFPILIGFLGTLFTLIKLRVSNFGEWLRLTLRGISINAAKIDYEGTVNYLPYRTRVQLDMGMATFFYYIFNNMDQIKGLQYFRRIPDQQRDWDDNNNLENPQLFEEFFLAQDKTIILPSGIKIYPYIQNRHENDESSIKETKQVKITSYSITVVYDKYNCCDKNMKFLLEHYKLLKAEYLEYRDNQINNESQYVYMFSHKGDDRVYFDRYSINNEPKRIEHIWFPEKDKLISEIKHFTNNKDFYYSKGKPYRKIILAHGEPGCGKTSFLMALINLVKCQRHKYPRQLIHLKLDELTRKDLMHILFKETLLVDNCSDTSVKIPFDRRIYYIEEIDGYKATHNRKDSNSDGSNSDGSIDNIDLVDLVNLVEVTNNSKKGSSSDKSLVNNNNNNDNDNNNNNDNNVSKLVRTMMGPVTSSDNNEGKLGIQDILEALDGIPSMKNGEIVFMTTNHIEKIDPALIRPGRVNHLLNFKKANCENTILQIEKYYDTEINSKNRKLVPENKWTPAEIESFCDASNDIENVLKKIQSGHNV